MNLNELALKVMESCGKHEKLQDAYLRFAHRLVAELAKQEPVAWTTMSEADDWIFVSGSENPNGKLIGNYHPLYAAPVIPAELAAVMADAQSWRNLENKMTAAAPKG